MVNGSAKAFSRKERKKHNEVYFFPFFRIATVEGGIAGIRRQAADEEGEFLTRLES